MDIFELAMIKKMGGGSSTGGSHACEVSADEFAALGNRVKVLEETPSGGGSSTAIIDVVELPTSDINTKGFYRLLTGVWLWNRKVVQPFHVYCVESLPSSGLAATNADQSEVNAYYNLQDGGVYGYVDAMLSYGLGVPQGWYPASTLFGALGQTYSGVISNVDDDPKDSTYRVLLKYTLYAHNGTDWAEYVTKTELDEAIANKKLYAHIITCVAEKLQSGIAYGAHFRFCVYRDYSTHIEGFPKDALYSVKGTVFSIDETNDMFKSYIITNASILITDDLNLSYIGINNGLKEESSISIDPETIVVDDYYVEEV